MQDDKGKIYCSENCFQKTWPHCDYCGKPMNSWTETKDGKRYCSERCYQSTWPRCNHCNKPMKSWTETKDGKKYCSEECYQTVLPRCDNCGRVMKTWTESNGHKYCSNACLVTSYPKCFVCQKPMKQWIQTKDGKKYCNDTCFEKTLPKCSICGKPVDGGIVDEDKNYYCNERCLELSWPVCSVCGKHVNHWLEQENGTKFCSEICADTIRPRCKVCGKVVRTGYHDEKGNHFCSDACYVAMLPKCSVCGKPIREGFTASNQYFCSDECYNTTLPKCIICGKPVKNGYQDRKGKCYCSDYCYETTLPKCASCGRKLREWIQTSDGRYFCDESCYNRCNSSTKIEMESALTAEELAYITGLSVSDCRQLMEINNIDGDQALEAIDIFMDSLNDNITVPVDVAACFHNANLYAKLANRLSQYNTMRGGVKGYGGFVFEELHAANAASTGVNIDVLGNNGIADFIVTDPSGKKILVQAKAGYKPNQIDWKKYQGQTIVVDKGNTALAADARAAGLKVQESNVFKKEADLVARTQQWESRITGKSTAPISSTMISSHYAGLASAKFAARVGVSFKMGESIYDVISGEKSFEEAAADIIVDGAVLVGGAYISGAALTTAGTFIAGTKVGVIATSAVSSLSGTAVGGTVVAVAGKAAALITTIQSAPIIPVVAACAAVGFIAKWVKSKF